MAAVQIVSMGQSLSWVAATAVFASGTPDTMENDGKTLLVVDIAAGGVARDLRFESQRDCDQGHGDEQGAMVDWQQELGAGANRVLFGPFPRYRYNNGSGLLEIRAEVITAMTYAGLRLANVRPV